MRGEGGSNDDVIDYHGVVRHPGDSSASYKYRIASGGTTIVKVTAVFKSLYSRSN